MQKPKNLLPGLFLCVFSRTAEPLVDFYCSNFWIFIWGRLFLPERKVFPALFIQAHFARQFHKNPAAPPRKAPTQKPREPVAPLNAHLEIPTQKARRAHHTFTARLYLACHRAQKAPIQKSRKGAVPQKEPTQKTPGVIPGVWLMKSSFNLRLTHCGRFLAGCTGPACSRRPQ